MLFRSGRWSRKELTLDHLGAVVRVDDLVAQSAEGEVGTLRDVGELARWRLGNGSACEPSANVVTSRSGEDEP